MKYYEVKFTISAPESSMQDARDLVAALAGEVGFESFEETDDGLKGYVDQLIFNRSELDAAIADFPMDGVGIAYDVTEAEYRDWNEQWEAEGFEPMVISGLCCINDGRHLPAAPYPVNVSISAKLAFGTGNHSTTRMMVKALLDHDLTGKTVLDCGCGTGILSIVALKRGAKNAVGYDIDEWSVDNARHNAEANGVGKDYCVLHGDAALLDSMERQFDVVVANIARNVLLNDMPNMRKAMAGDGSLLFISGFYAQDADILERRAATLRLRKIGLDVDGDWACLAFEAV